MREITPGFYWVKKFGDWRPACLFDDGSWDILDMVGLFEGKFIQKIGPRINPPAERKPTGRRAGRPKKPVDPSALVALRQGPPARSYRQIAKQTGLSVAIIHRAIGGHVQKSVKTNSEHSPVMTGSKK